MRPLLDLKLPSSRDARRWSRIALAVSLGVHAILLLVNPMGEWRPSLAEPAKTTPLVAPDTTPLVLFYRPPSPQPRVPSPRPIPVRERKPNEVLEVAAAPPMPQPAIVPPSVDTSSPPARPAPGPPTASVPAPGAMGRIGPELGDGKLWVQPLPLPPRELAGRLARSRAQLADSAVKAIVQKFLDSVAADPSTRGVPLPDWTGRIAGKKFGLDSTSLYVAGLKIPAAILALLPIPAGNIDQNRAYNRIMELRADIEQAARRADNLAEFKEHIREIRLRKEREEEFQKNRKQAPPAEPSQPAEPAPSPAPTPRDTTSNGTKNK